MSKIKLGIIKEGRKPVDLRAPLTPADCKFLLKNFPEIEIYLQPCNYRCIAPSEYKSAGVIISEKMGHCDILLGIKEVPVSMLIPDKTYLFFSHTIKKQPHNQKLLQTIIEKKIRIIDYECLTNETGERIIGFGRFAGIVGTHNSFMTWGRRTGEFKLKPAHSFSDYNELKLQYKNFKISPIKIAATGSGRVGKGVIEMLKAINIRRVSPDEFLNRTFQEAVYVHLDIHELYELKNKGPWKDQDFFTHPEQFVSIFHPYTKVCDLMINAIFWNKKAPRFFQLEDLKSDKFRIKVIGDVSCDIEGSIPCTFKATTIQDPVYGYNPQTESIVDPYHRDAIDIMAVDNLPCELPKDASILFGNLLVKEVIPNLWSVKTNGVIERATIAQKGKLMPRFEYLQDYVNGKFEYYKNE